MNFTNKNLFSRTKKHFDRTKRELVSIKNSLLHHFNANSNQQRSYGQHFACATCTFKIDPVKRTRKNFGKNCDNVLHYFLMAILGNNNGINDFMATCRRRVIRSADSLHSESIESAEGSVMENNNYDDDSDAKRTSTGSNTLFNSLMEFLL